MKEATFAQSLTARGLVEGMKTRTSRAAKGQNRTIERMWYIKRLGLAQYGITCGRARVQAELSRRHGHYARIIRRHRHPKHDAPPRCTRRRNQPRMRAGASGADTDGISGGFYRNG